jgi:caa(3)-type oxidase subunit IV
MTTDAQHPGSPTTGTDAGVVGSGAAAGGLGREAGGHGDPGGHEGHGGHASVAFYWMIGGILAVLTAMEVAAFYMELGSFEVPFLLVLSAAKFAIVVMFFMHLRFDSRVFTGVFMAGLVLAVFMITALVVLYQVLPRYES